MAKPRARKVGAKKSGAKKPARKAAAKKSGKTPTAAQRAAVRKSYDQIKKAHKALDLQLKKHTQMVSSMFFAG